MVDRHSAATMWSGVILLFEIVLKTSQTSFTIPFSRISLKKLNILMGIIAAYVVKTPNAFSVANLRLSFVSFIKFGISGINPFIKIGSIPTCLLKLFLHNKDIFSIKSTNKSETLTSLLTRFLTIEMSRVGKDELLVTSKFESSHLPSLTTFAKTSRAA